MAASNATANAEPAAPQDNRAPHARQRLEQLQRCVERAAHLLPAQGPITVFIHHNTLHALEDLPFAEAVKRGGKLSGCQPYLSEDRYRQELGRGRIRLDDLENALREDLRSQCDEKILSKCSRLELRMAMLRHPLRSGPTEELRWFVAETDALRRVCASAPPLVRDRFIAETRRWVLRDVRGRTGESALTALIRRFGESRIEQWPEGTWEAFALQALWRICCDGVARAPSLNLPPALPTRHRDLLLLASGEDSDRLVHDLLIRFCGSFLDQGLAHWQLPNREQGFFRAFCTLYQQPAGPPAAWLKDLRSELTRHQRERIAPLESIAQSLDALGVDHHEWESALAAVLLPLRGWAGMIHFLEEHPARAIHPSPPGSLVEYLAVRLILERLALAHVARRNLGFTSPLSELRGELRRCLGAVPPPSTEQRAFQIFQLAQVLGWTPEELFRLGEGEWGSLVEEIEMFAPIERRRIFHLAYEQRYYIQTLDAIALHQQGVLPDPAGPRFQAVFCLDEREESLRRHLEETAPDVQTFGVAGFYGVAMYYRGAADAHYVPLCPIVIHPRHWVCEEVQAGLADVSEQRAKFRRVLGTARHQFHIGSRTFAAGAVLTAGVGVLASIPLVARILFPWLTGRFQGRVGHLLQTPAATHLTLERRADEPGQDNGHIGFNLDEMTALAAQQLRDIGLTARFARLVFLLGHGSSSLNNPHKSAYDCGACGGSPGGPNSRALAQILNDPRVRTRLADSGLPIPHKTVFVGGLHNTCDDSIALFDVDRVPAGHAEDLALARADLEIALSRNAHERCRRFMSAPLSLSARAARRHVEERSQDLAQTRPELGHATNAICIVGRRSRTRGLFLDRRAFLTSYDPLLDDEQASTLTRLLQAAVPVCAGINLEYYFSRVDEAGWGCGTKLPHNVASLLGVMDGAASDLRTGLPWQMVEIHEPVRILFVIETAPEKMLRLMDRNPEIGRLIRNGWIRLATLDPHSPQLCLYQRGQFLRYQPESAQLPQAASSVDWYRGWRDHLEFAEVRPVT
jgi:uncharacterized protein YbcC (UPF0753/DUF2309 family)